MGGDTVTEETFKAFLSRLKEMREVQTQPNKIKFIDDIFEAIQYKERVIEANMRFISQMHDAVHKSTLDYFDVKLKLEGLALRYGIPVWEIEKWLRMKPDAVVREVKFWQKLKQDCDEIEGIKPEQIRKPRYASKPIGIPSGYKIKPVGFSLKNLLASAEDC